MRASLNGLILCDGGVNKGPPEAFDPRGIAYNCAAMDALLEEPVVDQPNVTSIDIPAAEEVYFIAEDGVRDERDHEDDRGPEEVAVEAEEEEAADVEEEVDTTGTEVMEAGEEGESEEDEDSHISGVSGEEEGSEEEDGKGSEAEEGNLVWEAISRAIG